MRCKHRNLSWPLRNEDGIDVSSCLDCGQSVEITTFTGEIYEESVTWLQSVASKLFCASPAKLQNNKP